jgi:hypothetical protein
LNGGIGSFDLLHFGHERSMLLQTSRSAGGDGIRVTHAYALDRGRVLPAASATVAHHREGRHLRAAHYRLVTQGGEVFEADGKRAVGSAEFSDGNAYTGLDLLEAESGGLGGQLECMWDAARVLQRMVSAGEL